jgi:hypothetical protein
MPEFDSPVLQYYNFISNLIFKYSLYTYYTYHVHVYID